MTLRNLLLASLLLSPAAFAAGPSAAVVCSPFPHSQMDVTGVVIFKGDTRAHLVYGNHFSSKQADYAVTKTDSPDLRIERFEGKNFDLLVNVEDASAVFAGEINGQAVRLNNLKCQLSEFDPHPGVTMGN